MARIPKPRTVLFDLGSRGPSAVRLEAIRLLGLPNLPERFPDCPRRSREALLLGLACDRHKSTKARLAAVKELLWGLTLEDQLTLEKLRRDQNT